MATMAALAVAQSLKMGFDIFVILAFFVGNWRLHELRRHCGRNSITESAM
jgi:hypothetical protein